MKKTLYIALPLVSAIMFSGCATVLGGGSSQTLKIVSTKSTPVTIYRVDANESSGKPPVEIQKTTAPATITVSRGNQNLLIKSDNNEFEDIIVEKKWNPVGWGNFIPLGLINFMFTTTDSVSGAMWVYDDNVAIPAK